MRSFQLYSFNVRSAAQFTIVQCEVQNMTARTLIYIQHLCLLPAPFAFLRRILPGLPIAYRGKIYLSFDYNYPSVCENILVAQQTHMFDFRKKNSH